MDLIDCASFFDDTAVCAPGSNVPLFMASLELFANQQRDGLQTQRRIVAYDPTQVFSLPADGIVSFSGRNWALGLSSPDDFEGSPVRAAYIAHMADTAFSIGTGMDWLNGTPRASSFGGCVWDKDSKDDSGTEEVWSQITLYTGAALAADENEFVQIAGRLYRVRNVYMTSAGLGAIEALELPSDVIRTVVYTASATFDKVANKPVAVVPVTRPALVMRYYQQSRVVAQAQDKPKDGDLVARVRPADYPALQAGDGFQVDGYDFKVCAQRPQSDGTVWIHLTR